MKIALIQQHCTKDKQENLERALKAAQKAALEGAKIIAFAELAFEPFYPQHPNPADRLALAEPIPGPTTERFIQLAKELGVVFVLNLYERDGDKAFDTSPVIDADGTLLGTTRMLHITDYEGFYEQDYYDPGDHDAPVYQTEFGKIGVSICYDRHYPEYMRRLALQGAEIVFVPQAGAIGEWPEGLYQAELRVAAFQNGYFTALCNRVGKEDVLEFAGESFVCDPFGQVIAQAAKGRDEILFCDIDLDRIKESPAKKWFFRDRRAELYGEWFKE